MIKYGLILDFEYPGTFSKLLLLSYRWLEIWMLMDSYKGSVQWGFLTPRKKSIWDAYQIQNLNKESSITYFKWR